MSDPIVSMPDAASGEPSRVPLFPVAGIAASAGGLEPLRHILAGLPESSGCAYVVIMHLDPNRESRLTDVLQRETKMPVVQAIDGQRVERDHVYVIPPANYLEIAKGRLVLSAIEHRPPVPMAADKFLASLAVDRRDHAVGIVLSGADGDGAIGIKAIKAEGGLVIAQAPESAAHPGMPRNALATGIVDHLLTADRIPQVLLHHIRHLAQVAPLTPQPHHAPSLAEILTIVRNRTELDFRGYKEPMLFRRVQRRMGMCHIPEMAQYIELLGSSSDEARLLASSFLIGVTEFFREPDAWGPLADEVLPNLLSKKPRDDAVRIWVPACSTGEEAYSLGMLVLEQPLIRERALRLQIFATDVDAEALKIARAGIYPASIAPAVGPSRLRRFFVKQGADYQVRKKLRESVVFAPQNVITDPPFSHMDLISCRNLMIYLGAEAQRRVLELFHFALKPGGCLFLGKSENVGASSTLFEPISQASRLYRSVGTARLSPRAIISSGSSLSSPSTTHRDYGKLIRSALLESSVPAAVLTNAAHQALYFYGPVDSFLTVRDGEPTADLLTLVRQGLRGPLADALRTSGAERRWVSDVAVVSGEGGERRVSIDVHPVDGDAGETLMLATFTFCGAEAPAHLGEGDAAIQAMEVRLNSSKRDRQRVIEELERANEELRVANEEALSMNEELQSTNEELETSKEELQSVNEELVTVNSELQENLRALEVANNDLNNLLASTHIPTVFLDRELRIKRFTAPATRLFNLIASDVGRPLCDITGHSDMKTLLQDIQVVLADLAAVEREVGSDSGEHYLRRVLPYRTTEERIEGVVVTFVDITAIRRSAERERRLAAVMQSSHDAVLIFDFEGKLFGWNRGAEALYGYDSEQALKMNVSVLIPDAAREAQRQAMERVRQGADLIDFASARRTRSGVIVHVSVTASLLRDEDDRPIAIATTERDVTERIRAETKLRESEQRFRLLADSAPVMIWMSDLDGTLQFVNQEYQRTTGRSAAVALGRAWYEGVHPDDLQFATAAFRRAVEQRARFDGVVRLLHIDSQYRWTKLVAMPRTADDGLSAGFVGSMTDIDVQKRAEDALREADRRKDEFLAMLGHELRNPLSPVRNAAEVLGMLHNDDPRLDWARRVIVRQVDYLTHLVDDLLDVSRITRGAIKLRQESVDMAAAVRRALEAVADLLAASNHELRVTLPNEPLYVEGDSVRLVQICENLLANAIKYSEVGSEIKIDLRLVDGTAELRVCDQGIGLAPEAIGRVFDLFVQDARAIDRSQGGLGIGLALVRHLVELHHGTVEAFSEGSGRGSEFTVRLPALLHESKADRSGDPGMAAKNAGGVRILVVDDDPDSAESMAMLLKISGHTVATAGALDPALEAARSLHPQLVLMDIGLPGADGYEVGRRLRTLPEAENAVIAALTGFGQADDVERTQRATFAHHFVKPVDPAEVERFIEERFGSKA